MNRKFQIRCNDWKCIQFSFGSAIHVKRNGTLFSGHSVSVGMNIYNKINIYLKEADIIIANNIIFVVDWKSKKSSDANRLDGNLPDVYVDWGVHTMLVR